MSHVFTSVLSMLVLATGSAVASDPAVSIEQYRVGTGPGVGIERPATFPAPSASGVEKPAALNGTLYAVIAPAYHNPSSTESYIRLFNGGSTTSTFSVTVVGSPSGQNYGTANIQVPRSASPQYSLTQIRTLANAGGLRPGDDRFSLYIQNPEPTAGYQHVIYNAQTTFFENASVCANLLNQAIAAAGFNTAVLTNVHTSRLASYPSEVTLHNYWNAPVTYRVTVIDNNTGAVLGTPVNIQTAANASYAMPMSFFEAQAGVTPNASQSHVNLFVTDPTGGPAYNVLGQGIVNQASNAQINMSTVCAVNAALNSGGGIGGGGLNGY
jgi:hypothetical protein